MNKITSEILSSEADSENIVFRFSVPAYSQRAAEERAKLSMRVKGYSPTEVESTGTSDGGSSIGPSEYVVEVTAPR